MQSFRCVPVIYLVFWISTVYRNLLQQEVFISCFHFQHINAVQAGCSSYRWMMGFPSDVPAYLCCFWSTKRFVKVTHPEGSSLWFYSTHPPAGFKGGSKVRLRVQISVDYHYSTAKALSVHRNMRCNKWIKLSCFSGKNSTMLTKLKVIVMVLSNNPTSLPCL